MVDAGIMTTTKRWGNILLGVVIDVIALAVVVYVVKYTHIAGWRLLFAILLSLWAVIGLVREVRAIRHLRNSAPQT